jgi:hypothetical protein
MRRLGKQRVEALQIINILEGKPSKWANHPIVSMWKGYTESLKLYCNIMIKQWIYRGYNNNMILYDIDIDKLIMPFWLGDKELHLSHQSNLVRKKPEYYKSIFPNVPNNLPYKWIRPKSL